MIRDSAFMAHRSLVRLALSAAHAFAWILIFQYYFVLTGSVLASLVSVSVTYALTNMVTFLAVPGSAGALRHGVRRSIAIAVACAATAFIALGVSFASILPLVGEGIAAFAFFMGLYRAFFWVPYAVRGSTYEPFVVSLLIAIVPAAAGFFLTISSFSPSLLLLTGAAWIIISLIPLSYSAESTEGFAWSYRQTFHELFSAHRRRLLVRSLAEGVEGSAALLVWPIVMFILLDWSYLMTGLALAATYVIGVIVRRLMNRYELLVPTLPIHVALAFSAAAMRPTALSITSIVAIDAYSSISRPEERGIDLTTREQSADNNTFVDEHTALREMGLALGRVIGCAVLLACALTASYTLTLIGVFAIASIAAAVAVIAARTR